MGHELARNGLAGLRLIGAPAAILAAVLFCTNAASASPAAVDWAAY